MAQFHVYRLPGGPLVLDLQSDLIRTPSRVVAPLIPEGPELPAIPRLEPVFEVEGERPAPHTGEMAAVPVGLMADAPVADLSGEDCALRRPLHMLSVGF